MHTIYTLNVYGVYMTTARIELKPYPNKVINVVKAKYELKDKSQAINKFFELYGSNEVEEEVSDEYVKKILDIENRHFKKYGYRTTSFKQLEKEIEGE